MTRLDGLVTADQLCVALQDALARNVPHVVDHFDLDLDTVTAWLQLPTLEALTSADYPVGAVTSPGLVDRPTRNGFAYDATWRLVAAVYDQGGDHDETAHRSRTWAAVLRAAALLDPTLGGLADSMSWATEQLDRVNLKSQARTLGAGVIAVDVHVKSALDLRGLPPLAAAAPPGPPVTTTNTAVTVRPTT